MADRENPMTSEEITPEERQRRLGDVYGLLISLARRKHAGQGYPDESAQRVSNSALFAEG